jgi:hypothetical protein
MRNLTSLAAIAVFVLGTVSCAEEEIVDGEEVEDFGGDEGQELQVNGPEYPIGPYGLKKGSIIENYKFRGFPQPQNGDYSELREFQLADLYNPTGDGRFAPDSIWGDRAKPKALVIDISSVWCGPCNHESDVVIPELLETYAPMGGEFLIQLADGGTVGEPATPLNLENWAKKYDLPVPHAIDPSYKLSALFEQNAYPTNIIVDLRTMKIVEIIAGAPPVGDGFWDTFEDTINGVAN